jgi:O-antigen ligase
MNRFIYLLFLIGIFLSPYIMFLPLGVNLTLYDFTLLLLLALVFTTKSLNFNGEIPKKPQIEYVLIYLFLAGSAISLLNAYNLAASISIIIQYILAIVFQFIIIRHIFKYSKDKNRTLLKILDLFVYSLFVVLVIGILAYLNILPNKSNYFSINNRLESVMGNANVLGKYLVYSLPILLLYVDLKRKTFLAYVSIVLLAINLLLTASFGSLGYAFVTVFYYYLVKFAMITKPIRISGMNIVINKKTFSLRSFAFLLFAFVSVGYVLLNPPEVFTNRVLAVGDLSEAGSFSLKLGLMKEAISFIIYHYGLIGMGLGSYPFESLYGTNVHNLYLLVFAEAGILGFVGLIGILLYAFLQSLNLIKKVEKQHKFILLGLNASLFGLIISLTTNTHTYSRNNWILAILLLVLIKVYKKKQAQ